MAELTVRVAVAAAVAPPVAGGTAPAGRGTGRIRARRPLKTLLAESTVAMPHASGGRDRWSEPLPERPDDGDAALRAALDEVLDPELPISVMELGLVYGVAFRDGTASVDLTFTATACPCMDFIKQDVRDRIAMEPWVDSVEINEVWDPPWTTARISEAGRGKLKALGVGA
ncbi:MAG: metal-sulfur cluster assembly factor [Gemmatimonadota bacterium]|nr:metal-sulfur cluster assembly factor [Gemmatimonadota bacterium]